MLCRFLFMCFFSCWYKLEISLECNNTTKSLYFYLSGKFRIFCRRNLQGKMTTEANISDSDLLEQINSEVASLMTPVIVYLGVLVFFGVLGNIFVCYYYGQQTRRSSHVVFICTIALFDLVSCAVSMPIEIVDMKFYYTFTNGHLCKFLRFVNHVAAIGSALTLIAISVDRFRRICRPLKKQLNLLKCKLLCALSFLLGLIYSWPASVVYKSVEVELNA